MWAKVELIKKRRNTCIQNNKISVQKYHEYKDRATIMMLGEIS